MESLSVKEAQRLVLSSQKLLGPTPSPLEIIEHLGYVQIDTISVVERAHHHVFWTRNPKYKPSTLDQLVKDRKVFEYWSHAASYLPMQDYRYTLPMKRAFQKRESTSWHPRDPKLMSSVLKRIKTEGPLRSKDFEAKNQKSTGWWDWKPAKKALERLFMEGKLEITERQGFQKVYDIPERVIPSHIDTSMPTDNEYYRFVVQRALRHHGLATANEIGYLMRKDAKKKLSQVIQSMIADGEITTVQVEKLENTYFTLPKALDDLPKMSSSKVHIFSPFDNLVIQRQKLKDLFDYEYQIECYVPAPKRQYGYFCLPIFKGPRPIGRIDCKADRKNKNLIVQSLHFEDGVDEKSIKTSLTPKLKSFAQFNGCNTILN